MYLDDPLLFRIYNFVLYNTLQLSGPQIFWPPPPIIVWQEDTTKLVFCLGHIQHQQYDFRTKRRFNCNDHNINSICAAIMSELVVVAYRHTSNFSAAVVVLLFAEHQILWISCLIKKTRNLIPNDIQRCQSIIICQVWNHEFKKPHTNEVILSTKICIHEKNVHSLYIMERTSYTRWYDNEFRFVLDQHTYLFFFYCSYTIVKCNIESLNR